MGSAAWHWPSDFAAPKLLKIIIMSGYSAEMATDGSASHVDFTYLAKPFELEKLATTVRRCLGEVQTRNTDD